MVGFGPEADPLPVDGPEPRLGEYENKPVSELKSELDDIIDQEKSLQVQPDYRAGSEQSGVLSKFFKWLVRRDRKSI